MRSVTILISVAVLLGLSNANADNIKGRVNILWDKPQLVQFVPDVKIFPGESMEIVSSDTVDVDHAYWETRECNWFGLNCWYEQRDRANLKSASQLEIEIVLDGGAASTGASPYKVDLPLSQNYSNFTQGVRLAAMLWNPGKQHPASRGPCIGRPAHCSVGDLTLTLAKINVRPRLDALEAILAKHKDISTLDHAVVTSTDFIDPLLSDPSIASAGTIRDLAKILADAVTRFRKALNGKTEQTAAPLHMKIIDLSTYALRLSQVNRDDAAKLRLAIMESYLDRGEYAHATKEAPLLMNDAKAAFDNTPNSANALIYAKALKANAAAWREKLARNSSADIRVSISLLDQAVEVLWKFTEHEGVSKAISDISVDAARMLNLLRTDAELKAAEVRLVRAICFQMHDEKGGGRSFEDWRSSGLEPSVDNCVSVLKTSD